MKRTPSFRACGLSHAKVTVKTGSPVLPVCSDLRQWARESSSVCLPERAIVAY